VLDYGCGPGDDVTGLALYSGADQVIGLDISDTALGLAAHRLGLHGLDASRVRLGQVRDGIAQIPLEDASVDYVHCGGVLHHTSSPTDLLREFRRVLRPGGRGFVMVYNSDSIWLHLYVAYEKMLHDDAFAGLPLDEAFTRLTDGPECPISRHYSFAEMTRLCEDAGLSARYAGGYLSRHELRQIDAHWAVAIADERLDDAHRDFLRELRFDRAGLPMLGRHHAGIGGVYHLRRDDAR
jgi:SAM-dependent methyltransferase